MSWSRYAEFLAVAVVVVLIPGPDFAVVAKNTLAGGRTRGRWTSLGICSSNFLQGNAAAAGLGALIVRAQPVFDGIKWAGVAYLLYLGVHCFRSALGGEYSPLDADAESARPSTALSGWRQGFLSNITNPKVLVFYLAVLPQFLRPGAGLLWLLVFAWSHAALSLGYLTVVTAGLFRLRNLLMRRRVRRAMDAATGTVLVAFSARLATEHA